MKRIIKKNGQALEPRPFVIATDGGSGNEIQKGKEPQPLQRPSTSTSGGSTQSTGGNQNSGNQQQSNTTSTPKK
jgi:hypothetical protein